VTNEIEPKDNVAVEVSPEAMNLPQTPSHRGHQTSPFAVPTSFEGAQILLQRAGEQLKVPDQENEKHKDRVAALLDQFTLDSFEKVIRYNLPIDERERTWLEAMDIKQLLKRVFRLTVSPMDLAVRYLEWLHTSLGTDEPNPLDSWLREFENGLVERYPYHRPRNLFRAAERQVFIWVELYVAALRGWIEEFCATLPWAEAAVASVKLGLFRPELISPLFERRNRLLEWANVMQIIEDEHLHASILPDE